MIVEIMTVKPNNKADQLAIMKFCRLVPIDYNNDLKKDRYNRSANGRKNGSVKHGWPTIGKTNAHISVCARSYKKSALKTICQRP